MAPQLDALGIVSQDIGRSLTFYALLGVNVPETPDAEDHVEAVLPSGLRLMWDSVELIQQISPSWEAPVGHRMAMAFLCESPAKVDQVFAEVVAAGFVGAKEPWDAFWGQRYAQLQDPDGNLVDLFATL